MNDTRLVYSTETGRICPKCQKPAAKCNCKHRKSAPAPPRKADGIIRIQREKKGRKGKTVTVATGFSCAENDLKQMASQLKNRCGSGGSVKDGNIIIQGDHREVIFDELKKKGFKVKLSGG